MEVSLFQSGLTTEVPLYYRITGYFGGGFYFGDLVILESTAKFKIAKFLSSVQYMRNTLYVQIGKY